MSVLQDPALSFCNVNREKKTKKIHYHHKPITNYPFVCVGARARVLCVCGCVLNHEVFCNEVLQPWMVLAQHLPGPPSLRGSADPRRLWQLRRETRRGSSLLAVFPVRPHTPQRSPVHLFSTFLPQKAKKCSPVAKAFWVRTGRVGSRLEHRLGEARSVEEAPLPDEIPSPFCHLAIPATPLPLAVVLQNPSLLLPYPEQ